MLNRRTTHRSLALAALLGSTLTLGCAARRPVEAEAPPPMSDLRGGWARWSRPSFTTIDRATTVSLVQAPAHDALIVEQTGGAARLWVISIPDSPSMYGAMEVGEGLPTQAWALASIGHDPVTLIPASGRIAVLSSDEGAMTAQVHLTAHGPAPTAGMPGPEALTLHGRIVFDRFTPLTFDPQDPETTSGLPTPPPRPKPKAKKW